MDNAHEPIVGSRLAVLDDARSSRERALRLLALALDDACADRPELQSAPVIVCLSERAAVGGFDARTLEQGLSALGLKVSLRVVSVLCEGSSGGFRALSLANDVLGRGDSGWCVVAAADSFIDAAVLLKLEDQQRLLVATNPDGVVPGEAAAALVLARTASAPLGVIDAVGLAHERSRIDNDIPLRADGFVAAARAALASLRLELADMSFRVSDAAGESFDFQEQSLLLGRLLRSKLPTFPLWLCAEALGDTGAAAGLCGVVSALAGFERGYAPGPRAIAFARNDLGQRAALVLSHPHDLQRG